MISQKIDLAIREISNFPKPGINFKDITTLLLDSELSSEIIDTFIDRLKRKRIDAIIGVESRGFLFGFMLANKMRVPFIPIRKVGKLPGETLKYKYDLEYGSAEIEVHKSDVKRGWNVVVHDDLLATGGTAEATCKLVSKLKGNIVGFTVLVELEFLEGRKRLKQYNVHSLVNY